MFYPHYSRIRIYGSQLTTLVQGRYQHLPEGFATSISGIMSQRLILNIRMCYYGNVAPGTPENFTLSTWMAASQMPRFQNLDDSESGSSNTSVQSCDDDYML